MSRRLVLLLALVAVIAAAAVGWAVGSRGSFPEGLPGVRASGTAEGAVPWVACRKSHQVTGADCG